MHVPATCQSGRYPLIAARFSGRRIKGLCLLAKEYVDKLTALVEQVDPKLPRGKSIEIKPFFGGAAAYVDGCIFMSLTKVGLALKLSEEDREPLFRSKQAKKLRYFPKAPIKKQYALFPRSYLNDCQSVKIWIAKSLVFVLPIDD